MPDPAPTPGEQAARLMEMLGLTEDELCQILDVDPLALISGQLEHAHQLLILLDLLSEPREQMGAAALRRWVRTKGPAGTPMDALLRRDFAAFEEAVSELELHGFIIKARPRG